MKVELTEITVGELADGYEDNAEGGVRGYGDRLDIRPPYQREFIYKDKQRDAVIDTVRAGFPLNVMYWSVREDGNFEIIDGQQRTISLCQFVNGDFSIDGRGFCNLQQDEQDQIRDYKLTIYLCSGTPSEKLKWFKTVNIAGEKLTDQELRNAVYAGSWVADAKRHFSRTGCPAYKVGADYLTGIPIRQAYLETAIKWLSKSTVEEYMADQQHEATANDLWLHFQSVIAWVKVTFTTYRKEMKRVDWGTLYKDFHGGQFDPAKLESDVSGLMEDEDVTKKQGIYAYVLGGKERHLNIRAFSEKQKREAYERQKGICALCGGHFESTEMEGDHITPWHEGGKTTSENCQMLCKNDNRQKGGK